MNYLNNSVLLFWQGIRVLHLKGWKDVSANGFKKRLNLFYTKLAYFLERKMAKICATWVASRHKAFIFIHKLLEKYLAISLIIAMLREFSLWKIHFRCIALKADLGKSNQNLPWFIRGPQEYMQPASYITK